MSDELNRPINLITCLVFNVKGLIFIGLVSFQILIHSNAYR